MEHLIDVEDAKSEDESICELESAQPGDVRSRGKIRNEEEDDPMSAESSIIIDDNPSINSTREPASTNGIQVTSHMVIDDERPPTMPTSKPTSNTDEHHGVRTNDAIIGEPPLTKTKIDRFSLQPAASALRMDEECFKDEHRVVRQKDEDEHRLEETNGNVGSGSEGSIVELGDHHERKKDDDDDDVFPLHNGNSIKESQERPTTLTPKRFAHRSYSTPTLNVNIHTKKEKGRYEKKEKEGEIQVSRQNGFVCGFGTKSGTKLWKNDPFSEDKCTKLYLGDVPRVQASSLQQQSRKEWFGWEFVIVIENPDHPDAAKNRPIDENEVKRLHKKMFNRAPRKAFLKAWRRLRPYKSWVNDEEWLPSDGEESDEPKCFSHGGSLIRGGEDKLFSFHHSSKDSENCFDVLTLLRNVFIQELVYHLSLSVEQVFSSDYRYIFILVAADIEDLRSQAQKTYFSLQVDLFRGNPGAYIPCTEAFIPLIETFYYYETEEVEMAYRKMVGGLLLKDAVPEEEKQYLQRSLDHLHHLPTYVTCSEGGTGSSSEDKDAPRRPTLEETQAYIAYLRHRSEGLTSLRAMNEANGEIEPTAVHATAAPDVGEKIEALRHDVGLSPMTENRGSRTRNTKGEGRRKRKPVLQCLWQRLGMSLPVTSFAIPYERNSSMPWRTYTMCSSSQAHILGSFGHLHKVHHSSIFSPTDRLQLLFEIISARFDLYYMCTNGWIEDFYPLREPALIDASFSEYEDFIFKSYVHGAQGPISRYFGKEGGEEEEEEDATQSHETHQHKKDEEPFAEDGTKEKHHSSYSRDDTRREAATKLGLVDRPLTLTSGRDNGFSTVASGDTAEIMAAAVLTAEAADTGTKVQRSVSAGAESPSSSLARRRSRVSTSTESEALGVRRSVSAGGAPDTLKKVNPQDLGSSLAAFADSMKESRVVMTLRSCFHDKCEYIYFGQKIGMYFMFLRFYCRSVTVPAFFGLIFTLIHWITENPDLYEVTFILYSMCVILWGTKMVDRWDQQEKRIMLLYFGTTPNATRNIVEPVRFLFNGKERRSPITDDSGELYFPNSKRIWRFLLSCSFTVFMVALVMVTVFMISAWRVIYFESFEVNTSATGTINYSSYVAGAINGASILFFQKIYERCAYQLTRLENHRTYSKFLQSYAIKTMVFQMVNCYSSLFYIAFFKDIIEEEFNTGAKMCSDEERKESLFNIKCNMGLLNRQLLSLFVVFLFKNVMELSLPLVRYRLKKFNMRKKVTPANQRLVVRLCEEGRMMPAYGSHELAGDGTIEDYTELVIMFGFVMLFSVTASFCTVLLLIDIGVEIYVDSLKLAKIVRRPLPLHSDGIGVWKTAFKFMVYAGVFTNALLLAETAGMRSLPKLILRTDDKLLAWFFYVFFFCFLIIAAKTISRPADNWNIVTHRVRHVCDELRFPSSNNVSTSEQSERTDFRIGSPYKRQ